VLPVLGAILVNAVVVSPFVAMLPVMLCVATTPSDTYRNGVPTRNGTNDVYCWLLLWLIPWLAIVWWVAAALLWKMACVGSYLSSLERATTTPSSPLHDRVRELNEFVMFAIDTVCVPIKGTPLYSGVLRLFGMRVGRKVCWLGERCPEPDLLSVGDGTLVAPGVDFFTHNREAVSYAFEPICIEDSCVLGERSALMGLSTMKTGSVLAPMAQGAKGMTFEAGKSYVGNPADARTAWR